MLNRITVSIAGLEYTLLSEETEAYMQKVAAFVDEKISEVRATGAGALEAAILGALNVADSCFKARETAANLREQVKEQLEESTHLRGEIRELRKAAKKSAADA